MRCAECRWAVKFKKPPDKSAGSSFSSQTVREALERRYELSVLCLRFPKSESKNKESFCGEFKQKGEEL